MICKLLALLTALTILACGFTALSEAVTWTCPTCHLEGITQKTCPRCATWRPEDGSADDPVETEETGARWITEFSINLEKTCSARVDWSDFASTHPGGYTLEWVYGANPDIRYTTSPETGTSALIALAPGMATRVRVYYNPDSGADLAETATPDPDREQIIPGDIPDEAPVDFTVSRFEIGTYSEGTGSFQSVERLQREADALFRGSGDKQLAVRYKVRFAVAGPSSVLFTWTLVSPENCVYVGVELKKPSSDTPDVEAIYPLGEITQEFLRYNDLVSGDYWLNLYAEGYPVCQKRLSVNLSGTGLDESLDAKPTHVPPFGGDPGSSGGTQPDVSQPIDASTTLGL